MDLIQPIGIIILCCLALAQGAAWLVDSSSRIAQRLGVSELVIGLTIVAFGTSAPEFAVTVNAALRGHDAVSIGNVVGSNIFNIGFILGGCALVGAIKTRPTLVWRDGLLLLVITAALLGFLADHRLARWEGFVLLGGQIGYLAFLFYKREPILDDEMIPTQKPNGKDVPLLLAGLVLIIAGGHFLVESSVQLAQRFGLSEWVIGVTIVAAGTSVPEFAISLVAILKKHHGISAGNLIGSNLFNTLGVLGVAGAIQLPSHPLGVDSSALVSLAMLIVLTGVVMVFMRSGWRISHAEGGLLVLVSLAIWVYNFLYAKPAS
ncbi:MAG: sodium:calcium antiporter [Sedimentisphaerales bacterium]|nr:sodium:calcium antiporter [Sedimentisphaerales bacterium]